MATNRGQQTANLDEALRTLSILHGKSSTKVLLYRYVYFYTNVWENLAYCGEE